MKNKLKGLLILGALLVVVFAPIAFAQPAGTVTSAGGVATCGNTASVGTGTTILFALCRVSLILNTLVPIIIVLGVVYFMYGVISYAIAKDEEAKTGGRDAMINGLIALLVITSIWGLVRILKNTFGVTDSSVIAVPCIESPGVDCP